MSKKGNGLGKFILGAGVGAALGLLFAPESGEETRKKLAAKMEELINKAKSIDVEEVANTVKEKIEELKKELADLDKEKAIDLAKAKAAEIELKCEELVDLAIEKGTPVLEDAAEKVRKQAVKVTKQVLKKLEAK